MAQCCGCNSHACHDAARRPGGFFMPRLRCVSKCEPSFSSAFAPLSVFSFDSQVLLASSPSPPLMFSFVLIVNKRNLAPSSELIGRSEPSLCRVSCLVSLTEHRLEKSSASHVSGRRADTSAMYVRPLSALMSFLMITAGCRWRSVGSL